MATNVSGVSFPLGQSWRKPSCHSRRVASSSLVCEKKKVFKHQKLGGHVKAWLLLCYTGTMQPFFTICYCHTTLAVAEEQRARVFLSEQYMSTINKVVHTHVSCYQITSGKPIIIRNTFALEFREILCTMHMEMPG